MDLRLNLDTTSFDQLVEIGRSLIPGLAPRWTDHNVHDPGIMLIELLAWVAEAQVYSLSRTRRDERRAYARLLGVPPRPVQPAAALIWPFEPDEAPEMPRAPIAGATLAQGTPTLSDRPDAPRFRSTQTIHLTAARLRKLETRFADGRSADWTRVNRRDGTTFAPFGLSPAPGNELVLHCEGPLIGAAEVQAPIAIGVETARVASATAPRRVRRLRVLLRDEGGDRELPLIEDTTFGLQRSGLLLIEAPAAQSIDPSFQIVVRSLSGGFIRPPRLQRVAFNVLPVEQVERIEEEEAGFGIGFPGQTYNLQTGGLLGEQALTITLIEPNGVSERWTPTRDLSLRKPQDRVFRFDAHKGTVEFGNGINGKIPPAGSALQAAYDVSRGAVGNVAAGARWTIGGFAGFFGRNSRDASGGRDADGLADLQARARARLGCRTVSVTAADLIEAARALPDLGVTSAAVLPFRRRAARSLPGRQVLICGSDAEPGDEPVPAADSADWLAEIRTLLSQRLPLGQRLEVIARRRVPIRVRGRLMIASSVDPREVMREAVAQLHAHLVEEREGSAAQPWAFRRDLSAFTVKGWLRLVEGVVRVEDLELSRDGEAAQPQLAFSVVERPHLRLADGDLVVVPVNPRRRS